MIVFILVSLVSVFAALAAPSDGNGQVQLRTGACGGSGLSGTLRDGPVSVDFLTCPDGDTCRTRITKGNGDPLTEVVQSDEGLTLWIAGIDATDPDTLTGDDLDVIESVAGSPEYELAQTLWDRLRRTGLDPGGAAMWCLSLQMQAYEKEKAVAMAGRPCDRDCHNPDEDCLGCCGPGCTSGLGCDTACTGSCLEHDLCFRAGPATRFGRSCLKSLVNAVSSMIQCRGRHGGRGTCCDL